MPDSAADVEEVDPTAPIDDDEVEQPSQTNIGGFEEEGGLILVPEEAEDGFTVLVHGITDPKWNLQRRWEGWTSWMTKMGFASSEQGFRCYRYDIENDESPIFNEFGIEHEALRLLEAVTRWRKRTIVEEAPWIKKRVAFVALDIGGIILKKAISIASHDPAKYGALHLNISGVMSVDCPHRACHIEQMEDNITELLTLRQPHPVNFIKKVKHIANAASDANRSFLETKILITTRVGNIISKGLGDEPAPEPMSSINQNEDDEESEAEDSAGEKNADLESSNNGVLYGHPLRLCFIFDTPFEQVYKSEIRHCKLIQGDLGGSEGILPTSCLEKLLRSVESAQASRFESEILLDLHEWVTSQSPPIYPPPPLLVPPQIDFISRSEPYKCWSDQHVFHVLHIHAPSGISKISRELVQHLNCDVTMTGTRDKNSPGEVVYFEFTDKNPSEQQMKSMLSYFLSVGICRSPALIGQMTRIHHQKSWALQDLLFAFHTMQVSLEIRQICFVIGRLDLCDDTTLDIFLNHLDMATEGQWKRPAFIITTEIENEVITRHSSNWIDLNIQELDFVLDEANHLDLTMDSTQIRALPVTERMALAFVSHAQRSLSTNELAWFLNQNPEHEIKPPRANDTLELLNGIDMIDHSMLFQTGRIQLRHAFRIRNEASFHSKILKCLLLYLRRPAVRQRMLSLSRRHQGLFKGPTSPPVSDLISYAVTYWPVHFQLSQPGDHIEAVCDFFADRKAAIAWSEAFRTLSNPVTRLNRCYLSPIPLVSMLGLEDVVSALLEKLRDTDDLHDHCLPALIEAAQHGHTSIARKFLGMMDIDDSTLTDAILAAAQFGSGDLLFDLVTMASRRSGFQWPNELLCRAASHGNHRAVRVLLDAGVPVNPVGVLHNRSPLHMAALHNHEETVRLLLERNADVNCRARYGRTPLSTASYGQGSRTIIKLLIEAGSDLNTESENENTPLQLAIVDGNIPAIEELLEAGANIEVGKTDADSLVSQARPLIYCAQLNHPDGVRLLLNYSPDVNCTWKDLTPLWIAVSENNLEIARLLLEHGANPNHNPHSWDMTLLLAVEHPNLELVKLLVDHGADLEQEDNSSPWRSTALSRVAGTSNVDILKYLLQHDPPADIAHVGENSQTPLYVAAKEGLAENVRILLEAGSDPTVPTGAGYWIPLYAANGSPETIKVLLSHGCDIDATSSGRTVLHVAILENQPDSVKMLLRQNPKPNVDMVIPGVTYMEGDENISPLSVACARNHPNFVRWLIEAGADTDQQTSQGRRPLDIAIENDATPVFEVLMEYRVSVDYSNDEGNTVLHRITRSTKRAMVRALVNAGASITAANKKGVTPLQTAVELSNIPVAKFLLSRGASPNQFGADYHSLLHIACVNRDLVMLRLLVERGASVLKSDRLENAPRLLTSVLQDWTSSEWDPLPPLLSYLIEECKLDPNARGGFGDVPLVIACYFQFAPQARYLLQNGADPNLEDGSGRRALHTAALHSDRQLLDPLLEFGAKPFDGDNPILDKIGRTPVHFAAVGASWNVFLAVCKLYGEEELHRPDDHGWTPLFWALLNPGASVQIVQHLIDHGADLWMKAKGLKHEWSPLKLARYTGVSNEILALLVPDPLTRQVQPGGGEVENWIDEDHFSRTAEDRDRLCDSCRVPVCGIGYRCPVCRAEDLCFRCYMSRDVLLTRHADLEWLENGPEFGETEDPLAQADGQNDGNVSKHGSVNFERQRAENGPTEDHEQKDGDASDLQSRHSSFEDLVSDSHISDSHLSDESDADTASE